MKYQSEGLNGSVVNKDTCCAHCCLWVLSRLWGEIVLVMDQI